MLEWLKRHAWKACIPLKGIGGSNPPLSANVFLGKSDEGFPILFHASEMDSLSFLNC